MPRRSTLVLAAILTALVAGMAVYIHLTWSPPPSLEFRYLGSRPMTTTPAGSSMPTIPLAHLDFEVRNHSMASIHLTDMSFILITPGTTRTLGSLGVSSRPYLTSATGATPTGTGVVVPPHGVVHCSLSIPQANVFKFEISIIKTQYTWISSTKARLGEFFDRTRTHLPARLSTLLPFYTMHSDITPVEK